MPRGKTSPHHLYPGPDTPSSREGTRRASLGLIEYDIIAPRLGDLQAPWSTINRAWWDPSSLRSALPSTLSSQPSRTSLRPSSPRSLRSSWPSGTSSSASSAAAASAADGELAQEQPPVDVADSEDGEPQRPTKQPSNTLIPYLFPVAISVHDGRSA
ncbi:hypothetical protein NUW54_g2429 [Trametes sanguinea]|uniref:Uncharacterized protein n=1 Tax=Trametes sanguinea TaxID=158606 RepID=A0ACC1Q3K0_9APHY|nr:hypothetical protein NUW54_g2429 [Trametes sanguinea]